MSVTTSSQQGQTHHLFLFEPPTMMSTFKLIATYFYRMPKAKTIFKGKTLSNVRMYATITPNLFKTADHWPAVSIYKPVVRESFLRVATNMSLYSLLPCKR